jgi:hypothetical protein
MARWGCGGGHWWQLIVLVANTPLQIPALVVVIATACVFSRTTFYLDLVQIKFRIMLLNLT